MIFEKCPTSTFEDISTETVRNEPLQQVLGRKGKKRGLTFWQNRKISKLLEKREKQARKESPAKHRRAFRNLVIFYLALDTALRGGDLMKLKISELFYSNGSLKEEFETTQQKTGKDVACRLGRKIKKLLLQWRELENLSHSDYLFRGCGTEGHFTIRQYRRIVKIWVEMINLPREIYSTHSMRRTAATLTYEHSNNLELVRVLLGHVSISSTQHYLGLDLSKALLMIRKVRLY